MVRYGRNRHSVVMQSWSGPTPALLISQPERDPPLNPERFRRLSDALRRRQPDLTVLMERVHKVHNLSAILRNCDAVGVLEAQAVRPEDGLRVYGHTSAGTSKWVRVRKHASTRDAIAELRARGMRIVAAHPGPDVADFRSVDFTRPTAVMVAVEPAPPQTGPWINDRQSNDRISSSIPVSRWKRTRK